MVSDGATFLIDGYWWEICPALILIVLTAELNFTADGLRDPLDALR